MLRAALRTVILGPPGAGKGTISERIVKDFPLKHLSSGDVLRMHINQQTDVGREAKKYIDAGQLVPDKTMVNLINEELKIMKGSGWLLDGFPRTVSQAEALQSSVPVDVVINLNVPFDVIIERIKGRWLHPASGRIYHTEFNPPEVPGKFHSICAMLQGKDDHTGEPLVQRDDDKEHTVKARLENYKNLTQPVLKYYSDLGLLAEFKGNYSNEIWPQVHRYLSSHIEPLQYSEYH